MNILNAKKITPDLTASADSTEIKMENLEDENPSSSDESDSSIEMPVPIKEEPDEDVILVEDTEPTQQVQCPTNEVQYYMSLNTSTGTGLLMSDGTVLMTSGTGLIVSGENGISPIIHSIQGNAINIQPNVTNGQANVSNRQDNVTNIQNNIVNTEGNIVKTEGNIANTQGDITKHQRYIKDVHNYVKYIGPEKDMSTCDARLNSNMLDKTLSNHIEVLKYRANTKLNKINDLRAVRINKEIELKKFRSQIKDLKRENERLSQLWRKKESQDADDVVYRKSIEQKIQKLKNLNEELNMKHSLLTTKLANLNNELIQQKSPQEKKKKKR